MDINDCCGEIIGGDTTKLTIRQKSNGGIEVGDLLIEEKQEGKFLLQVFELRYGSQISDSALESISGMRLEGIGGSLDFIDPHLRNYVIVSAKVALDLTTEKPRNPKILPDFMGSVRHIKNEDLNFLTKPDYPLYLGKIRSGSKVIDTDIFLNGNDVIPHHILIPATTGRGKSNLIKVMLWNVLDKDFCGILVLDPHDEYYGKTNVKGLRDHPKAREFIRYYSPSYEQGAYTLVVNLRSIHPHHFRGISNFSEAQEEAMAIAYHQYRDDWIESILNGTEIENVNSTTIHVLRRKLDKILGVYYDSTDNQIKCRNRTFSNSDGEATMKDITTSLEQCKKVIIDTSRLEDEAELLIGSIIAQQILHLHKSSKEKNELQNKPVISIVIEEAPRVLGDQVLRTSGSNVYSDIAKEGRKFKIGLIAITQLTSVIPKTILANMNTKIILGNELNTERNAIIQSASQDLSNDDRNIASLDKGEAIISSNFARFAVPVKIPLFEDEVRKHLQMVTKKHRIGVIS